MSQRKEEQNKTKQPSGKISKKAIWAGSSLGTFRVETVGLIIHPAGGQLSPRPLDLRTQTLGDDR